MNDRALAIARIAGIEIRVHLSWIPGLALITVFAGLAPYGPLVDRGEAFRFAVGGAIALLVLVSLGAHELAHSLVARRRGLGVGPITLGAMGGATRADDEPRTGADELAIAGIGPLVSLGLGAGLLLLSDPLDAVSADLGFVAAMVGGANLLLGLFNLVPAVPLDGGRVLHGLVWRATGDPARGGRVTGLVGRWTGGVVLTLGLLVAVFGDGITGIILVAGGWVLIQGSRISDRRARIEALLAGLSVSEAMERDVPGIGPSLTVDTFADQLLSDGERTTVPVVDGGSLLGMIGIAQLRRIARRRWSQLRAADVMVAPPALPRLAAEDGLWTGMELLRRTGLDGVPVMAGTALLGILTRRAVVTAIQARVAAAEGGVGRVSGSDISSRLLSVEEALQAVLAASPGPLPAEAVAPEAALGRWLAAPVIATTDLPPWDNSAMDGYAIRAADTADATEDRPVVLRVIGEVRAGEDPDGPRGDADGLDGRPGLVAGTAIRIATGARLPSGADAVVPVEDTTPLDAAGAPAGARGREATGPLPVACSVHVRVAAGGSVRRRGDDLRGGTEVLSAGQRLTPGGVALAAGAGVATVSVHRRPRVGVLATGDEIREPGSALGPAGIPDANGPGLRALVASAGAIPVSLGVARDVLDDVVGRLRAAIDGTAVAGAADATGAAGSTSAAGAGGPVDAIIVSGGVSVGPYDVVRTAFDRLGRVDLWRVAVQPGKPFAFGVGRRSDGGVVPLFGLPGNPVSTAVTFELFVRPSLRRLAGEPAPRRDADRAVLNERVSTSAPRRAFLRVVVERDAGGAVVRDAAGRAQAHLAGGQGSHVLSALGSADALAIVPEGVEVAEAGSEVALWWLDRG